MQNEKVFNILHVITKLPVGGAENMLLRVVKSYDKDRFRISICCINEGGEIADELQRLGFKVEILNKMKGHGVDFGAIKELYKLMKKENIHILRTHQYHANLYGRIAGILAGVPVIISSFHNLYEFPSKPKLHRRLFNNILSFFSDALVAVSHSVASDMERYDKVNSKKIEVIYNGIEIDQFSPKTSKKEARNIFSLPIESFIIGTVGNLTEQKGHRFLIEAASKLRNSYIAIVGDGPLKNELKHFAHQLKVDCRFIGTIDPKEIPLFLKAIDIFCFPSLWEGFGGALIEAMASGLPIVASDIPPHKEVVGDSGILIPSGNSQSLSKILKTLIDNTSLRSDLAKKSLERSKLFSIDNTVKSYEELFDEILKRKGLS